MSSRVTFSQINGLVQSNIQRNYAKIANLQEQLSSGKAIQRPSDAPVDLTKDLQLRSDLRQLEQFKRNIEDGMSYLTIVESTMSSTNDLFQRSRELALQARNDTNTDTERAHIMSEVKVILDSMVATANRSYNGAFVFAGTETRTPPYELREGKDRIDSFDNSATDGADNVLNLGAPIKIWDRNVTDSQVVTPNPNGNAPVNDILPGSLKITGLTEGEDYEVDYVQGTITFLPTTTTNIPGIGNLTDTEIAAAIPTADPEGRAETYPGWPVPPFSPQPGGGLEVTFEWIKRSDKDMDGVINREIEVGLTGKINVTASEVFGSPTDVTTWDAMVKLMEGLHKDKGAIIGEAISDIDSSYERILTGQATMGARMNRIEMTQSRNDESYIETTRLHSFIEDIDFAKVISEFLMQESVYNASLQSGARVIQPTLANFL
ncbi:MAG: flagellar hook-associated protein FlgL [Fibrobacteria bacterium]|nr:flagellar hook-associated protein FlgL [Fibrobacteria bacterium]